MKQSDEELRAQINEIIKDEIQEGINDYIDTQEESQKTGLGFVSNKDEKLKVNIPHSEVDKIIKKYNGLAPQVITSLTHMATRSIPIVV